MGRRLVSAYGGAGVVRKHKVLIFDNSLHERDRRGIANCLDNESANGWELLTSSTAYDAEANRLVLTVIMGEIPSPTVEIVSTIDPHMWEQDLEQFNEVIGGADA
jgi:hypothetical protein